MKTAKELEALFGVDAEQIDEWEAMASAGTLPGDPTGEIVRGPGRPQMFGEEMVTVTFKIPKSQLAAMDERARSLNEGRSDYLRGLVEKELEAIA